MDVTRQKIETPESIGKITPSKPNCPYCHGTGWELYRPSPLVYDYLYGGEDCFADFAKRCSKCKDGRIQSEDRTDVPSLYSDADLGKFNFEAYQKPLANLPKIAHDYVYGFNKWREASKGLYLWSKTPGSGKTFLACCLAKSAMVKNNLRMKFITAPAYMDKVSESYKREQGAEDPTQIYKDCEVLILDDIGAQMDKEWQRQELFKLIDIRASNNVSTIFTSNYSVNSLNVDERTKSRILKVSVTLQMPEESIREKIAKKEQDKFLDNILGGKE